MVLERLPAPGRPRMGGITLHSCLGGCRVDEWHLAQQRYAPWHPAILLPVVRFCISCVGPQSVELKTDPALYRDPGPAVCAMMRGNPSRSSGSSTVL